MLLHYQEFKTLKMGQIAFELRFVYMYLDPPPSALTLCIITALVGMLSIY